MTRLVVVGSINSDLVVQVAALPSPGETVLGHRVDRYPGGKGLNQAVAAARMGAEVVLVGAVGDDADGTALLTLLDDEGIEGAVVTCPGAATGLALIEVADDGENRIVVVPGANRLLDGTDVVRELGARSPVGVVLAQAEIPVEAAAAAMAVGRSLGAITVLNASPADLALSAALADVDVVVVNEHEAALMTGSPVPDRGHAGSAARALVGFGPRAAVVTLGSDGVVWATADGGIEAIDAHPVVAVDTVGAGDAFCGALAAALAAGLPLDRAVRRASAAGAIAATRHGAVPSLPAAHEVDELLALG